MNRLSPIREITIAYYLQILKTAQQIHNKNGEPIPDIGQDGIGKVESSLKTPFQSYGGRYLYKGFNKKASALFYFLIKNHCLQNGNKRMAILTLSFFIYSNNRAFAISENCLYALAKHTADSKSKRKCLKRISNTLYKTVKRRTQPMINVRGMISVAKNGKKSKLRLVMMFDKYKQYFTSAPRLS
jgi:prophage maintenance system killer protein